MVRDFNGSDFLTVFFTSFPNFPVAPLICKVRVVTVLLLIHILGLKDYKNEKRMNIE